MTPSALDPAGPGARAIADLTWLLVAVCGVIYLVVLAVFAWALMRATRRGGDQDPVPAPHGERRRTITVSAALAATVLVLCGFVAASYATDRRLFALERGPAAAEIKLTAHQWWWELRYDDPVPARGFTTANELHLPLGELVRIRLSSNDGSWPLSMITLRAGTCGRAGRGRRAHTSGA